MTQKNEETIELEIKRVAYGGKGIGLYKNKTTFVPKTIEGDLIEATLVKEHKKYCEANLLQIKEKSPFRIDSPCIYSKECGGCQWIDVDNKKQIEYKENFIKDSFERIGKTKLTVPLSFFDSKESFYYRNRILFRETYTNGSLKLGFFAQESHNQVHVGHCKIAHPAINDLLVFLNQKKLEKKRTQKFRLEVQVLPTHYKNNEPHLLITIHPVERNHELEPLLKVLQSNHSIQWVSYKKEQKKSLFSLFEQENSLSYYTKPGIFQQINTESNHELRKIIKQKIKEKKIKKVLDLYCGSGNLSLGLTQLTQKVLGIEDNKEAITVAQHNVKQNKLESIEYKAADSSQFLKENLEQLKEFDCLILDPPRKGAKEDIQSILKISPRFIFYVSCDPTTAARDYSFLKEDYKIIEIKALNFFPQTYHIESFFILEKN